MSARRVHMVLTEKSVGRIYQHYAHSDAKSFGVVTSWRQDLDAETNKKNFDELKQHIRKLGLGYIELEGHYREKGQKDTAAEPSLFIPGISKDQVTKLGDKFGQDSVLYSGPETHASHPSQRQAEPKENLRLSPDQFRSKYGRCPPGYHHDNNRCQKEPARVHMIHSNGSHEDLGVFHPDVLNGFYSRIKKHSFKFDGLRSDIAALRLLTGL